MKISNNESDYFSFAGNTDLTAQDPEWNAIVQWNGWVYEWVDGTDAFYRYKYDPMLNHRVLAFPSQHVISLFETTGIPGGATRIDCLSSSLG